MAMPTSIHMHMRWPTIKVLLCIVLFPLLAAFRPANAAPLTADPWGQVATFTAATGADNDHFGAAVARSSDGNTLIAGASGAAGGGIHRGEVYVFTKPVGGWASSSIPTAILTVAGGGSNDLFGTAVAVSGNGSTIIASAPHNAGGGTQRGAAYMFTKPSGGWANSSIPSAKLIVAGGADGDDLGMAVALSADGGVAMIGAPNNAGGGVRRGVVYIFTKPTAGWTSTNAPIATLSIAGGESGDNGNAFGRSLALITIGRGSLIAVGAPYSNGNGAQRGAVYVFTQPVNGWETTSAPAAKLTVASSADNDLFGSAVAFSSDGNTLMASAPFNAGDGTQRGAAYIFTKPTNGWTSSTIPAATLTTAGGSDGDNLGTAVALSSDGSTAIATAPYNSIGMKRGAVYGYNKPSSGWANSSVPDTTLTATGGANNDYLGFAMALSADGRTIVVGAPGNAGSTGGNSRGAVYVFTLISTNANLSGLALSRGTLSPTFSSGTNSYTAIVPFSANSLTITPTAADSTASIKVNGATVTSGSASGSISLSVGENTIIVRATAEDGSTIVTYTITVNRAPASTNADLSGLVLSQGILSPSFASATSAYTAAVPQHISSITVTATTADATTTITVNGTIVASGSASGAISLGIGDTPILVRATAQDGTPKTYSIIVTRAATVVLPLIAR